MKIGLTQFDIVWEDKGKNMENADQLIKQAAGEDADLIVFPEMTLTGFTTNTALAGERKADSATLAFFKKASLTYNISIAFGYVEALDGRYYNKLMIVSDGQIVYDYAKIHPFNFSEEGRHYTGGSQISVANIQDMIFSGFVCYDLRFPEIFQAVSQEAEAILVIANWPKSRITHWDTLLRARAIENQCYILGVNRIGDGDGLHYAASSVAYDPSGRRLTEENCSSALQFVDISSKTVQRIRRMFPFKQDRRPDIYLSFKHLPNL